MEIVGVEINGVRFLPYRGKDNSSGYFRSFMHYCIDRYFDRIIMNESLNEWFSLIPNDPIFKGDLHYNYTIEGYHGMFFSMHTGTSTKINRIKSIARTLRIEVFVHVIE